MRLNKKINVNLYLALSVVSTVLVLFFSDWLLSTVLVVVGIAIATVSSHLMLVEAVLEMLQPKGLDSTNEVNNRKILILLIGKSLILVAALLIGVHFIDQMIIIAVANYILQIIALIFSLKRN